MKNLDFRKILLLPLILLFCIISCCAFLSFFEKKKAVALETIDAELFLPATELEYQSLTSPIDVYHDNEVTAIAQGSDLISHTLTIYYQNKKTTLGGFTSLKQVKRLNQSSLIVLDNAGAYKIDLENLSIQTTPQLLYYTSNSLSESDTIRGNHFDIKNDYLVTSFGVTAMIYNRVNGEFVHNTQNTFSVKTDSPLTMNSNGDIFYVSADGLVKINVNNINDIKVLLRGISPERIIADNQFVYFIINGDIYKADHTIPNTTEQKLMVDNSNNNFDLGKITIPKTISFKGNNILIVSEDTVQEFRVNGTTLEFTGYAIASGKTAYNRISKNAQSIEKYGDKIAVLDGQRLTVVNTKTNDRYAINNYRDYTVEDDITIFALGNKFIFTANNSSKIKLIDLSSNNSLQIVLPEGNHIYDACYQSGKFYVYAYVNNDTRTVYSIDENDPNHNASAILSNQFDHKIINVDVFGNVILSDSAKIQKFNKKDNYALSLSINAISEVKEIATDIGGGIYFLDGNDIYCVKGEQAEKIDVRAPLNAKIKSFGLDIFSKDVYFIYENQEFICHSDELKNLALTDVNLGSDYITTAQSSNINDLKIYKPIDSANVYSFTNEGNKITFNRLIAEREEYVYISPVTIKNDYNFVQFFALVGQNNCVIVNSDEVAEVKLNKKDATNSAFTATGVNMYYLPIITKNVDYALSNANEIIRLDKGTEIKPEKVFTYLGCEFYYASVTLDGITYKGYIPTAFTTKQLAKDFKWDEYRIEEVNATTLYSDKELTQAVYQIEKGTQVRVYQIQDGFACVAIEIDGVWTFGFILEDSIRNQQSVAIRNVLVILAVAACVCATTTYFILRKKD